MKENVERELTGKIVSAAFRVHSTLGPGLLESVYERCLCQELTELGIAFESQVFLPVQYRGVIVDAGLRIDILVGNRVIVEVKAVERLNDLHSAQILTYLKLTRLRVGLLINFNTPLIKDGIRRLVL